MSQLSEVPSATISPYAITYDTTRYYDQFAFQRRYVTGQIINIGCNSDGANLKRDFGAVNIDICSKDVTTGEALPVDFIADARNLSDFQAMFDTSVLGEILEHMEQNDAIMALTQAKNSLMPGGKVLITMPHDNRGAPEDKKDIRYAPGIYAYHYRYISREELMGWIKAAGLVPTVIADIAYVWGQMGTGVVAVAG